jgi:hypothetical protein
MKPLLISLIFTFLLLQNVRSQDSLQEHPKTHPLVYSIKLFLPGEQSLSTHLMNIKDSSLYTYTKKSVKPDPFHKVNMHIPSDWESFNYKFVTGIKVRNKSLRAWVIPTFIVAGILAGALIGKSLGSQGGSTEDQLSNVGSVIIGGLLGGTGGVIIGAVICSAAEKKYMINGEWKSFEELKATLKY